MDSILNGEAQVIINREVGSLLKELRLQAGISLEKVALDLAKETSEKIKRIEAGVESFEAVDVAYLLEIYDVDFNDFQHDVQSIVTRANLKAFIKIKE